jgi:hypothetical protein
MASELRDVMAQLELSLVETVARLEDAENDPPHPPSDSHPGVIREVVEIVRRFVEVRGWPMASRRTLRS